MLNEQQREEWLEFLHAQHPDIDPRTLRLMDELRHVSHMLYQVGETSVATADLSYAQYRILMMLFFRERAGRTDGLNPSEISERSGTSRNTISALIRTLEDGGYIRRELDTEDRRKFNILLADPGRELVVAHIGRHMQVVNEIFRVLSSEEMEELSKLLHKVNDRALSYRVQCNAAESGGSHASSR